MFDVRCSANEARERLGLALQMKMRTEDKKMRKDVNELGGGFRRDKENGKKVIAIGY